jgi:hypothetical protein
MSRVIYIVKRIFGGPFEFFLEKRAFFYSRFFGKPLIWAIGDSHVRAFRKNIHFLTNNIGPATAFNLKNEKSTTDSNKKLFRIIKKLDKKKDIAMLSFGEVDCRVHIYNEFMKNNKKITISALIDKTISNYGEVLKKINQLGLNFCVYSIPPAGTEGNILKIPYYALREVRGKITKELNEKLEIFCQKNDIKFINVFPKVSDEKGLVLKEFVADEVHLNDKVVSLVLAELNQKFKINL